MKTSVDFETRFERRSVRYYGILVVGRDASLTARELDRKQWRLDKVKIDSRDILCLTFDQLYVDLNLRLQNYIKLARSWSSVRSLP